MPPSRGTSRAASLGDLQVLQERRVGTPKEHRSGHPDHEAIIALQRAAGNAAVLRLLDGDHQARARLLPPNVVQRCGTTSCDCPDEAKREAALLPNSERHVQRVSPGSSDRGAPPTAVGQPHLVAQGQWRGRPPPVVQPDNLEECLSMFGGKELEYCKDLLFGPPAAEDATGCSQLWQHDTACLATGYFEDKKHTCCNTWPPSVQHHAIYTLGLSGAASCNGHRGESAIVKSGDKTVKVLCADALDPRNFKPRGIDPKSGIDGPCGDKQFEKDEAANVHKNKKGEDKAFAAEVIELSPDVWNQLPGKHSDRRPVSISYSGTPEASFCYNNLYKKNPQITDCLPEGCPVPKNAPPPF